MATSDFALSEPNVTNAELQVSIINHQSSIIAMTTYKTVLFKFKGNRRTLDTGLTLEEAQQICKHDDSSSGTCMDKRKLAAWGRNPSNPWFIGYTEE